VRDNQTGRPKGFGFVKYSSEEEAQKAAKAMDGRVFALLNCYLPYNLHALFADVNTFRILHTEIFNRHLSEMKPC
jgi:RNA recognition motif-containing protein